MADPAGSPRWLRAARVRRPHGIRGEVRVEPLGSDAARFTPGLSLRCEGGEQTLIVRSSRPLGDGDALLTFEGVVDRDAAGLLRGTYLCISAEGARPLGPDEWFVHDLIGLRARDPSGAGLGTVRDVESYPANDVLVVVGDSGTRRFPMVAAFVQSVDVKGGEILVTPWPEDR